MTEKELWNTIASFIHTSMGEEYLDSEFHNKVFNHFKGSSPTDEEILEYIMANDPYTSEEDPEEELEKAIKAALSVLEKSQNHWEDQERDERGRFGSGGGGGPDRTTSISQAGAVRNPGGGGRLAPAPKLSASTDSQRRLKQPDMTRFAGQGKLRDLSRSDVLRAYKAQVNRLDPNYTKSKVDNGAVWSGKWVNTAKPEGWRSDMPWNPRPATNKPGDWKNEYKPPIDRAEINRLLHKGDLGEHQAKIILHELYAHARQRQGDISTMMYGSAKNFISHGDYIQNLESKIGKLPNSYEAHHMIPAAKGGSNHGANLAILSHTEHVLAHDLEAVASRSYSKNPDKRTGMTTPLSSDFAGYGRNDSLKSAGAARYASALLKNAYIQAGNLGNYSGAALRAKRAELKTKERPMAILKLLVKAKVLDSTDFKIKKIKDQNKIKHRPVFRMSEDAAYAKLADYLERNKYV